MFAQASMQEVGPSFEERSRESAIDILQAALREMRYKAINQHYQLLLNKIGQLEKGGQADEMEQALIELEATRQKKTQFEEEMRGEKQ